MTAPRHAPSAGIWPTGRTAGLLGLIILAAVVIRVDVLRTTAPPIPPAPAVSDAAAYRLLAANLADGRGYVRPFDLARTGEVVPTAEYPPGYPVLLAGADLVGIESETGQRLLLCLVGGVTVGLVGLVGRRLGGDGVGLGAAMVAAVHPSMWSTDTAPLAESLATALAMGVLLAALAVHDRPAPWRWVLLGAVAALGGMVRAEVLLVGLVAVGGLLLSQLPEQRRRMVGAGALALLGVAAVIGPWTARNAVTFGQFVPLSNNAGSVLRGANCDGAYQGEFRGLWVTNVADVGGDDVDPDGQCFTGFDRSGGRNEAEAAALLRAEGLAYAGDHIGEVPGVVAARIGRTIGFYRFDQQVNFARFEGRAGSWDRAGTILFQVLSAVAVLGAIAPWRGRTGPRWLLLVPVAAVLCTVAVTYGNLRFRAIADPAVVLAACLALADGVRRINGRPR